VSSPTIKSTWYYKTCVVRGAWLPQ